MVKKLLLQGVGYVPDGYFEDLSKEFLAHLKEVHPDTYESLMVAAEEFGVGKAKAEPKPEPKLPVEKEVKEETPSK